MTLAIPTTSRTRNGLYVPCRCLFQPLQVAFRRATSTRLLNRVGNGESAGADEFVGSTTLAVARLLKFPLLFNLRAFHAILEGGDIFVQPSENVGVRLALLPAPYSIQLLLGVAAFRTH